MLNRKTKIRCSAAGFTLIELIAAMVILALLASGVTLGITRLTQRAKVRATVSQISNFGSAISAFHLECGFYPNSLQDLISQPSSGRNCKGYPPGGFLEKREIPEDPFNTPYTYASPGIHNPDSYDLWSNGPDGEDGTSDDISNWSTEAVGDDDQK